MTSFIKALNCENTSSPPCWLMRQAGRYMPEYMALKKKYSLLTLFKTTELIIEVSTLPEKLLGIDASILFSDILMVLELFDKKWSFKETHGPVIHEPLTTVSEIGLLTSKSAKECVPYIFRAVSELKKSLNTPLIGFAGAPFTIASYLIEGGTSKDLRKTKTLFFQNPKAFHQLLDKITNATIDYLTLQISAGVDAVQLFDSWTHVLSLNDFKLVSLHYLQKIINALKPSNIPIIVFCKNSSFFAKEIFLIRPHCISVDWHRDLRDIRNELGSHIALQGNLDPLLLLSEKQRVKSETVHILKMMKNDPGYIFNLGHGIVPETPFENVKYLVDTIKEYA